MPYWSELRPRAKLQHHTAPDARVIIHKAVAYKLSRSYPLLYAVVVRVHGYSSLRSSRFFAIFLSKDGEKT